jgi:hypothetical protein
VVGGTQDEEVVQERAEHGSTFEQRGSVFLVVGTMISTAPVSFEDACDVPEPSNADGGEEGDKLRFPSVSPGRVDEHERSNA